MKIGIDIDDTLTNTKEAQLQYWKEYVSNNKSDIYSFNLPENINRFGDPYIDLFWDTYREALFAPPFKENAGEVISKLRKEGHIIYIITSRPKAKYDHLVDKLVNVFKSNNIEYDFIITDIKEKGKYISDNNIDILIDDDVLHCEDVYKHGKTAILFNKINNYNHFMTDDWKKVYDIISKMKK